MKTTFKTFKLTFKSPLHLAKGKDEYDVSERVIHSDTLKSALFACALQIFGEKEIDIHFLEKFVISSAFPYFENEYFFPKPFVKLNIKRDLKDDSKQNKTLKKIEFVGKSYFEKILRNEEMEIPQNHLFENGELLSDYEIKTAAGEDRKLFIYHSQAQQRVTIPYNFHKEATPFYFDRVFFQPKAGLYFIIQTDESRIYDIVKQSLKLLGDNGIGSATSVGNGQFDAESSEITIAIPEQAGKMIALSLYCPEKEELTENFLSQSSYNFIKRGGYIANPSNPVHLQNRKKSVYMFTEGSVFPKASVSGKILNLQPTLHADFQQVEHPIWRDGRALFITLNAS